MERAATNLTRESGMTILEVLFAMVILAILMMGALQSLLAASMLNQETSRQAAVANLLRDKTSEVLRKAKQYTPDAPLVRDSGKQYSNIDAMIRWYADSANHSFQLDRNTFKAPAVGANALDIVNGTVTCFLNELQIPGDLGGSRTNPLWDNVLHVGPMDLDGVNDTTGTADGLGNYYNDHSTPTNGRYGVNIVPVEVKLVWNVRGSSVTEYRYIQVGRTGQ